MGLFGSLLETAFDVVTSPIDLVKDVVNGDMPGDAGSNTEQKLKKLDNDLKQVGSDLGDL